MEKIRWDRRSVQDVLQEFRISLDAGLNTEQVSENQKKYGLNQLKEANKKTFLSKVADQFKDFLILILLAASVVSFSIGEKTDAMIIV
ncbi:MAG: cation-transporting P-type ATPase, partial [Filifactor alocis]|uniref:cation-transporting P-type ATPase n=1 Tax=Filifactor alocis TaxID=143361 RepID=UPI003FA11F12